MKSNIKECAELYSKKFGCSKKESEEIMRNSVEVLCDAIADGGVTFMGQFSIEVAHRAEKMGHNPATGEKKVIPAHNTLKLTIGKQMKERINK